MDKPKVDCVWTVAEAKARLSELIDRAEHDGPQVISRRGKETVVVVATDEWHKKSTRKGSLAEFFANSPLVGSGLEIDGMEVEMEDIDFDSPEYQDSKQ